ncbi:hypothetical protein [Streptomyces lonarensis]|uniref:Uncharacterized protein n=1 Tax=Streptomyces lonarensis TaxID=700599 RepID=A0A7X6CX86_9ACTN|nr:hypothetical protein [Streptomyces lonarensis]NJQ04266.1 hypothetical protein [Streptomyces lonarensis]
MTRPDPTAVVAALAAQLRGVHPLMLAPVACLYLLIITLYAVGALAVLAAAAVTAGATVTAMCLTQALSLAATWRPTPRTKKEVTR